MRSAAVNTSTKLQQNYSVGDIMASQESQPDIFQEQAAMDDRKDAKKAQKRDEASLRRLDAVHSLVY